MHTRLQDFDMTDYCYRYSHKLHLNRIPVKIAGQQATGCLSITDAANDWTFYLEQGKSIYASNSLNPFERLDSYLRQLQIRIPRLTFSIRTQVRLLFEKLIEMDMLYCGDYEAICWLMKAQIK